MPEDKLKSLYDGLSERGDYTKSYEEFASKYSDEGNRKSLYEGMVQRGYYTKTYNDFNSKFFSSTPSSNQQTGNVARPIKKIVPITETKPVDDASLVSTRKVPVTDIKPSTFEQTAQNFLNSDQTGLNAEEIVNKEQNTGFKGAYQEQNVIPEKLTSDTNFQTPETGSPLSIVETPTVTPVEPIKATSGDILPYKQTEQNLKQSTAYELYNKGNFDEAKVVAKSLPNDDPYKFLVLSQLSAKDGDLKKSNQYLDILQKNDPTNIDVSRRKIKNYIDSEDLPAADKEARNLLKIDPNNLTALETLSKTTEKLSKLSSYVGNEADYYRKKYTEQTYQQGEYLGTVKYAEKQSKNMIDFADKMDEAVGTIFLGGADKAIERGLTMALGAPGTKFTDSPLYSTLSTLTLLPLGDAKSLYDVAAGKEQSDPDWSTKVKDVAKTTLGAVNILMGASLIGDPVARAKFVYAPEVINSLPDNEFGKILKRVMSVGFQPYDNIESLFSSSTFSEITKRNEENPDSFKSLTSETMNLLLMMGGEKVVGGLHAKYKDAQEGKSSYMTKEEASILPPILDRVRQGFDLKPIEAAVYVKYQKMMSETLKDVAIEAKEIKKNAPEIDKLALENQKQTGVVPDILNEATTENPIATLIGDKVNDIFKAVLENKGPEGDKKVVNEVIKNNEINLEEARETSIILSDSLKDLEKAKTDSNRGLTIQQIEDQQAKIRAEKGKVDLIIDNNGVDAEKIIEYNKKHKSEPSNEVVVKKEEPKTTPVKEKPETKNTVEEETTSSPSKETTSTKFVDKPIKEIQTDEKRFQNREELNQEHVKNIADNWNDNTLDPIVIWKDAKGNDFLLSGHHRFAAAKSLGLEKIDSKYFKGTEQEAINFATKESNANRLMEQPFERAKIYSQMRSEGKSTKEISDALKIEGKNRVFVENLSYLNPKGKVMYMLKSFGRAGDTTTVRTTERIADFIGNARRYFKELTDAHESEMYAYLSKNDKIKSKTEFIDILNRRMHGIEEFKPNEPLNFEHKVGRGSLEIEVLNEITDLKREQTEITKDIKVAQKTIKDKVSRDAKIKALTNRYNELQIKIGDSEKKLNTAKEADKSQTSIFDELNTEIENGNITEKTIEQFENRTGNEIAKSEPIIKDIESKAENADSLSIKELEEGIKQAEDLFGGSEISKKDAALQKISEGTSAIMSKIGATKNITEQQRTTIIEDLQKIVQGLSEYSIEQIKSWMKDHLTANKERFKLETSDINDIVDGLKKIEPEKKTTIETSLKKESILDDLSKRDNATPEEINEAINSQLQHTSEKVYYETAVENYKKALNKGAESASQYDSRISKMAKDIVEGKSIEMSNEQAISEFLSNMVRLKNSEKTIREELATADPKESAELSKKLQNILDNQDINYTAARKLGRSASNVFRLLQQVVKEDYSYAGMKTRYEKTRGIKDGEKWNKSQEQEFKNLYDSHKKLEEDYNKLFESETQLRQDNEILENALKEAKEIRSKEKADKKTNIKEKEKINLDKSKQREQKLRDKLKEIRSRFNDVTVLAEQSKIVTQLVAEKVYQGATKLDAILKSILEDIKDIYPEWTEKDIRDRLLHKEKGEPKPSEQKKIINDLKSEARWLQKYDDLLNDKVKSLSEKKKIEDSEPVKKLKEQYKELEAKKMGLDTEGKSPEEISDVLKYNKTQITRIKGEIKKAIEKLDELRKTEKIAPKPEKKVYEESPELELARQKLAAFRAEMKIKEKEILFKNRTPYEKSLDMFREISRELLMTYPGTYAKISGNVLLSHLNNPIEKALLKLLHKVTPKALSENAKIFGEPKMKDVFVDVPKTFVSHFTKEGMADWNRLYSIYGEHFYSDLPKYLQIGATHAFLKGYLAHPMFIDAKNNLKRWYQKNEPNLNLLDPAVNEQIEREAFAHAMYSILMNENKANNIWKDLVKSTEKNLGKTAATLLQSENQIVKVPSNYIARSLTYQFGLIKGLVGKKDMPGLVKVFFKGAESLKPEQADFIYKNMSKGGVGLAYNLMAVFLYNQILAITDKDDTELSSTLKKYLQKVGHAPFLEPMYVVANMVNEAKKSKEEKGHNFDIMDYAQTFTQQEFDVLKKAPYVNAANRGTFIPFLLSKKLTWNNLGMAFTNKLVNITTPGLLKEIASWTKDDKGIPSDMSEEDKKWWVKRGYDMRAPKTPLEVFYAAYPFLINKIPPNMERIVEKQLKEQNLTDQEKEEKKVEQENVKKVSAETKHLKKDYGGFKYDTGGRTKSRGRGGSGKSRRR